MVKLIAFDADDTLWHNEIHYARMAQLLCDLLEPYGAPAEIERRLYETELRNLPLYGYGTKGYTLSVIETAIDISNGEINGRILEEIIRFGQVMLAQEIHLLPHVAETLDKLAGDYNLMVITKGDLLDQERKLAQSGIAQFFRHIEIVSDKSQDTYLSLFNKYGVKPANFLMAGNSLKSDVLPVIALGAYAVYIPYALTWVHENTQFSHKGKNSYFQLEHIGQLPDLIRTI